MKVVKLNSPGKYRYGFGVYMPRMLPSVPVCGQSAPDSAPDFFPSQNNPFYINHIAKPMGRQLRGLGTTMMTRSISRDPKPLLSQVMLSDDTVGNGIFDPPSAPATAHAKTGVFESKFSLPGYVYRERPTFPSEITDTTTGNPIVYLPNAGGSWIDDVSETYRSFDAETPRYYALGEDDTKKSEPSQITLDKVLSVGGWVAMGAVAAALGTLLYKKVIE
jgi:hypothetical protein